MGVILGWVVFFLSWAYKEEEGRQGKGITDRRRMMHLSFVFSGGTGDDCVVVGSIWNRETITTGKSVEKE